MYAYIHTANIDRISADCIKVEAVSYNGLPGIKITGLPDPVVKESFYRVSSAFRASGIDIPLKRFVINFVPADIPKKGSGLDLAIATVLLKSIGVIPNEALNDTLVFGELSLTGEILSARGVLAVLNSAHKDFDKIIIPYSNANEAYFFKEKSIPIKHIKDIIKIANKEFEPHKENNCAFTDIEKNLIPDFSDVIAQPIAIRCAQLSVIGKHHMLLIGSPGCGKTMIGERMPGIMPELTENQKLEVNSIYSISGLLKEYSQIINTPPFRSPHHSSTDSALIGGARIGEISLAHKGILFLDELSEFKHNVLNALREPLEKGYINISRASYFHTLPADFLLIAASNPCNCGNILKQDSSCNCSMQSLQRFKRRLNGPLMDRFDIKLVMSAPRISVDKLSASSGKASNQLRTEVLNAINLRNDLCSKSIKIKMSDTAKRAMDLNLSKHNTSIRSVKKAIALAKSIALLEQKEIVTEEMILESLSYTRPLIYEDNVTR